MSKKKPPKGIPGLLEMLRYKRPSGSTTEKQFIRRFVIPSGAVPDLRGNLSLTISHPDGTPSSVAWLSHTDTVHRTEGLQRLSVRNGFVRRKSRYGKGECLGADDTTGVWLMLEMIRAKVPGLYIFHHGEEIGGIGSSYIATHRAEILEDIHYAISFDRYGTDSVVTHQAGRETASDVFAWSLIDALELWEARPDPTGVFTDSENYAHLVAECSNLSVGYWNHHTSRESQDLAFAKDLRDRLVEFDETKLLRERTPTEEPRWNGIYSLARWDGKKLWADEDEEEWKEWWVEEEEEEEADPWSEDDGVKQYVYENGVWIRTA